MEISFQLDQKNILIKVSHPFFDAACNSFSVYVQFQVWKQLTPLSFSYSVVQIEAFFVQRQEESDGQTAYGGEEDDGR